MIHLFAKVLKRGFLHKHTLNKYKEIDSVIVEIISKI